MAWVMETEGPEPSSDTQLLTPNQAAQSGRCAHPHPKAALLVMNFYSCLPDAVPSRNEITLPTATMNSPLPWEKQPP
jgi:hypothetical protein